MESDIRIDINKKLIDRGFVHQFLQNSYWSKGITFDKVSKLIKNTPLCFGLYKSGKQIGFGRVITDYYGFAYLLDFFIDDNFQGRGYGKYFFNQILDYPLLSDVKTWLLKTADAHDFYKKFGFGEPDDSYKIMQMRK